MTGPRPLLSGAEAAAMAKSLVGYGTYNLQNGGDCMRAIGPEAPHAEFDCWGLVCKVLGLRRHRPRYNRASGPRATVVDDINGNSAIEDALYGGGELFRVVQDRPRPGDILSYSTITATVDGVRRQWIGHGAIAVDVSSVLDFDPKAPRFSSIGIVQCIGPNGRRPAILRGTGAVFDAHTRTWGGDAHPERRSYLLRAIDP